MQELPRGLSLSGVRAFEAAARLRSFSAASLELGVTPSAVSHQVRQLEVAIGTKLFVRRHKAVDLTPEGAAFFKDASPAIEALVRARFALQRDATTVVVKSSHSFAVRWLVPRLKKFTAMYPRIQVTVETRAPPVVLGPGIDVALPYVQAGGSPYAAGVPLLVDHAMPVKSPDLRTVVPLHNSAKPLPIVAGTTDDWDWKYYLGQIGLEPFPMRVVSRFDTDDAAIRATLDGMGVSLQTRSFILPELSSGVLEPVGLPEIVFGTYWLLASPLPRRATELFTRWLQSEGALVG